MKKLKKSRVLIFIFILSMVGAFDTMAKKSRVEGRTVSVEDIYNSIRHVPLKYAYEESIVSFENEGWA